MTEAKEKNRDMSVASEDKAQKLRQNYKHFDSQVLLNYGEGSDFALKF
jgi:hypothetical protein